MQSTPIKSEFQCSYHSEDDLAHSSECVPECAHLCSQQCSLSLTSNNCQWMCETSCESGCAQLQPTLTPCQQMRGTQCDCQQGYDQCGKLPICCRR
ncbi:unnamed protein product [Toxocara canis]|uniref:Cysteine-rich venom protein 1-like n=1 Tax=Toxocara canis TaxID=6265 RepID=A0A183U6X1_TOXCA|nr:unnamed protein product [Toxocara canis]